PPFPTRRSSDLHVHAIHLAMRRHRGQVDHARREEDGQPRVAERPGQGPQTADPPGLPLRGEESEPQVLLGRLSRGGERETVAGRTGDAVEGPRRRQQTHKPGGVREGLGGGDGAVQEHAAMLEPAQVDGERPRVDPDHAGHAPYLGGAINSRATSAMVSASSTRSLRSNRRAMHALCTFILRFPMASAPKHTTPSFVTPSSVTFTPSMPSGGTAFTSATTLSPGRFAHACLGMSITPAGPALSRSSARSQARTASLASDIAMARTVPPNRLSTRSRARSPASALRDVIHTSAPALANSPAARIPTGPVPATIKTRLPRTSPPPAACSIFATAATAVVLDPFESSMAETVKGLNIALVAAVSSCSPTAMSAPPTNTAV